MTAPIGLSAEAVGKALELMASFDGRPVATTQAANWFELLVQSPIRPTDAEVRAAVIAWYSRPQSRRWMQPADLLAEVRARRVAARKPDMTATRMRGEVTA